jgi:flagellar protein FlaI
MSLPRASITSLDIIVFLNTFIDSEGKNSRRVTSTVEIVKQDLSTKRIISVTPFKWISQFDDRFEHKGGSVVLKKICEKKGWNEEQINNELSKRKEVLDWMCKNNLRSYEQVGQIVAEFSKDPDSILKKIKNDA